MPTKKGRKPSIKEAKFAELNGMPYQIKPNSLQIANDQLFGCTLLPKTNIGSPTDVIRTYNGQFMIVRSNEMIAKNLVLTVEKKVLKFD